MNTTDRLLTTEVYFPYIAAVLFFFTLKLQLPVLVYLITGIIIGIYFSAVRLFVKEKPAGNVFHFSSSLFCAFIIGFTMIYLLYPESGFVHLVLIISGLVSFAGTLYIHFTNKSARLFFLMFGFSLLTGMHFTI
jgi:hypothetical protein